MERKRKVPGPDGALHDATEVGFRASGEHWNEYLLDDGTVARLKLVVTGVLRPEDPDELVATVAGIPGAWGSGATPDEALADEALAEPTDGPEAIVRMSIYDICLYIIYICLE